MNDFERTIMHNRASYSIKWKIQFYKFDKQQAYLYFLTKPQMDNERKMIQ